MSALKPLKRLVTDWFLGGMLLAVSLAWLFPNVGKHGGTLHAGSLINAGVFLVFFLHGINLSTEQIKKGLGNWRLHAMVQVFTFAIFPLFWLGANKLLGGQVPPALMLGFFYLCALPSTISSSVALTGSAGGNVPAAILNASLSSLLGVFLTPWLISLVADANGGIDLGKTLLDLSLLLLLPLLLGQILRPLWGKFFARYKRYTGVFDKLVILLLVFASFSDSVAGGVWQQQGPETLIVAFVGCALLLALMLWLTTRSARSLGFSHEDEIAAVFCATKKSLAAGAPMAAIIFGASPALGLILLPIMLYHQMQLIVCAVMAERYSLRGQALAAAAV
ncbi:bile acid:sodium symporter [Pseudomonas taiwanensis]|uniref:bile acid:sodium symporter family protein n=1 Tax=Pseudomonas taiwanensis TaxID=470150 RepID=UPI0015BEF3A9|nr:bile acid:sodium symporter family protein [Pseudomonas taiwanensis]NWL77547.1 bile acid:sodium symporter [Pseudomonas taiwanensis]